MKRLEESGYMGVKKHTAVTVGTNPTQALHTRQSDALTSPRSGSFLYPSLFVFILGARHICLRVCRSYDLLEMNS